MLSNIMVGFVMFVFFFIVGFGLVFYWYWMGIIGLVGILGCMIYCLF